jgi:TPR repeat protein
MPSVEQLPSKPLYHRAMDKTTDLSTNTLEAVKADSLVSTEEEGDDDVHSADSPISSEDEVPNTAFADVQSSGNPPPQTDNVPESLPGLSETEAPSSTSPESERRPPASEDPVPAFVDSVVENAAFAHGLESERARVQSLINNLVDKVKRGPEEETAAGPDDDTDDDDDATEHAAAAAAAGTEHKPLPAGLHVGVPYGDLRSWCAAKPSSSSSSAAAEGGVELQSDMFWSQTMENVTLTFILQVTQEVTTTARDVRVLFRPGSLAVSVAGESLVDEQLMYSIDVDLSLWSLDRSNPDAPALTLELEKTKQQWWPSLFACTEPAVYAVHQPKAPAHLTKAHEQQPPPPPPPPPPQEYSEKACGTAPPPDTPPPSQLSAGHVHATGSSESSSASPTDQPGGTGAQASSNHGTRVGRSEGPKRGDIEKVVEQYRLAFDGGGPGAAEAALQLAAFHHHGIGVKKDDAHAARLYRYALERGVLDSSAAFQLGLLYNQGCDGLNADPEEAVRWWTVSAKLGNPVALFNLGVMYMNGSGCVMDPQLAMTFFERAHSMNPQLRPPMFSSAQLNERVAQASRMNKLKYKSRVSEVDRQRRLAEAKDALRLVLYGSVAVFTVGISAAVIRNWWRNRL